MIHLCYIASCHKASPSYGLALCFICGDFVPVNFIHITHKADSRLARVQWETSLQSNALSLSHWLGANLESALIHSDFTDWYSETCL